MKQVIFKDKENNEFHFGILTDNDDIICGCYGSLIPKDEIGAEHDYEILKINDRWVNLDNMLDSNILKIDYKNWIGCKIVSVEPAVEKDGRYLSDRKKIEAPLVSNEFDVILVEDWCKWYCLYYLTHDENNNEILISFTFGDIIDGCDHYYYPKSIVDFALKNNLKIDAVSYIAICKMYIEDALENNNVAIPDSVLPSYEDLEKVISINKNSCCVSFYISGEYDVHNWRNNYYVIQSSKK